MCLTKKQQGPIFYRTHTFLAWIIKVDWSSAADHREGSEDALRRRETHWKEADHRPLVADAVAKPATGPPPYREARLAGFPTDSTCTSLWGLLWLPDSTFPPAWRCPGSTGLRMSPPAMTDGTRCSNNPSSRPLGGKTRRRMFSKGSQSSPAELGFSSPVTICPQKRVLPSNFPPCPTSTFPFQVFLVSLPKRTTCTQILISGSASGKSNIGCHFSHRNVSAHGPYSWTAQLLGAHNPSSSFPPTYQPRPWLPDSHIRSHFSDE